MTRREWIRLGGFGAAVLALHALGLGLILYYSAHHPALIGLATLAYGLGLRHGFDADHISAIDNTTRKLLQDGRRPLGLGFFFSLGHSTIVLALAVGLAIAATTVSGAIPDFQTYGGYVGASVSGTFLVAIGVLNLLVLIDIAAIARRMNSGSYDAAQLEQRLLDRGLAGRLRLGRLLARIDSSPKMYPLGLLFGLGFDTASEIGLLALTAGAAGGQTPLPAILALPIVFAAGMSLVDTADGVFMCRAYAWAFSDPVRKVFYNLTVTGLSVAVALMIGTIELGGVMAERLGLNGGFWSTLGGLDFELIGYLIVGLFVATWLASLLAWKLGRFEQRWRSPTAAE
jgi:nickel/cobalt transporter (NiCoT) family protein